MVSGALLRWTYHPRYFLAGVTYSLSNQREKLSELKDKYAGKPMLLVGNGPSLNRTPLDQFAGLPSIGMNKIDMLFDRTTWRPSMIVTVNSMVVRQHAEQFAASEIPVYISWKARWFMPRRLRHRINYFYQTASPAFSTDITKGVGSMATVTYACLQFAYSMGANPVILVGVDHSYSKVSTSYSYETRKGPDSDHFDPNYFASGTLWGIPNLDDSESAYRAARHAFEQDGRTVLDATVDGKLQVFDKISIEQALERCGR
jgi:hypothetical protein